MNALYIPNEDDFRRWIREAVEEAISNASIKTAATDNLNGEPLLSRREIAGLFQISLVTLHNWIKQGLPSHKQQGRVYFLRSEVMSYLKKGNRSSTSRQDN